LEFFSDSERKVSFFRPCIWVAIGRKRSEIARIKQVLLLNNALRYTSIVFTGSESHAAVQYLAPYAGSTMGE
jgi:F0F1-type ATP synthase alpha subunit